VCQNYVSKTRDQGVFNANVILLAISDNSEWLATVERRPFDEKYVVDDVLKFWTYNDKLQRLITICKCKLQILLKLYFL